MEINKCFFVGERFVKVCSCKNVRIKLLFENIGEVCDYEYCK